MKIIEYEETVVAVISSMLTSTTKGIHAAVVTHDTSMQFHTDNQAEVPQHAWKQGSNAEEVWGQPQAKVQAAAWSMSTLSGLVKRHLV